MCHFQLGRYDEEAQSSLQVQLPSPSKQPQRNDGICQSSHQSKQPNKPTIRWCLLQHIPPASTDLSSALVAPPQPAVGFGQFKICLLAGPTAAMESSKDWPLFSAAIAVARECLPASLPHVTRCISDCLDTLSQDGTFAASCRRGDSPRELSYLFARNPTLLTQQMVKEAARSGHVHVLQWIAAHDDESCDLWKDYDFSPMDEAAKFGHLNTVKWLHLNRKDCYAGRAMSWAAANGHLEMVQWLHTSRNDFCATFAMDFAAGNGHLEVVKWLHCNLTDGCTTWAMDSAALNNHLEVLQWLHTNRHEGCTKAAIDGAAGNGHLQVVQWLLDNVADGMNWRGWAFIAAVDKDQLETAQWVFSTFHERLSDMALSSALASAMDNGYERMAQWLRMERRMR